MNADPLQPTHCGPGDSLPRVLFLIKSATGNEERRAAQHNRWLKDLPAGAEHYFCISGQSADAPQVDGRRLLLPGHDGYEHLPAKMKRLVAWVAEESGWDHFDYVVTLDDDVVVELGRLYDFLRCRPDHFGNRWDGDPAHISGMFVGYSIKAFHIMAGVIGSIPDTGPDDLLLGRAVREPFASLNVMTDCDRFKPYGTAATEATIAVEIRPFRAETMRDYRFPSSVSKRVSFCLFGSDPKYCLGALANVELIQRHYPGWEAVFFTKDVPAGVIGELRKQGATVVECAYANMMLARFLPFCEPGVVLSRDCDSRIGEREVRAVREWLASDKPAHIIRDHPEHIPGWAMIPGGLWGSRLPFGNNLRHSLEKALNDPGYSGWGGDQRWLVENVWRPDGFTIHQYNQVDWMRESWNPNDYCGMRHEPAARPAPKEVVLFEGFFNRLNGLVNALLTHGPEFRIRWAVNGHLPHRFGALFEDIPGLLVCEEEGLGYWPENTDPARGPLCYWFVSRRNNTTAEEVAEAYRYFLNRLRIAADGAPAALGIHFRGLHHASRVTAEEFARWCVTEARARGADQCFAIADSGREQIAGILAAGGIGVIWGRSAPLREDLDRSGLEDLRAFIGDALALADCKTVLTSFAETTIVDPARAFGREVIDYSGSRAWSECWFHHSAGNRNDVRVIAPPHVAPHTSVDAAFESLCSHLDRLGHLDRQQYLYGTHLEVLRDVLAVLRPNRADFLLEVGGGYFSTPLLLCSGATVITLEQGQNVPAEVNADWLRRLREAWSDWDNWVLMDLPGTSAWRDATYPPDVRFCFVDGNGNCRKEIVEFMLARGVKVVAAHDSETPSFRYDQVAVPADCSVYDFRAREVWTRVWSRDHALTAVLDGHPSYRTVGRGPETVDLRRIPVCLIGGEHHVPRERHHRYWDRPEYSGLIFPHTNWTPPMPGGGAYGCSAAHRNATEWAITACPGSPVLLMENDAVQTEWFNPLLGSLPADADIIWLGCSSGASAGGGPPDYFPNRKGAWFRLKGRCQSSHAVLLVTDLGKRTWLSCCERALGGEFDGSTDLACSAVGATLCTHYVAARPLFYQPDYPDTLTPLPGLLPANP